MIGQSQGKDAAAVGGGIVEEPFGLTAEEEDVLLAIGAAQGMPQERLMAYLLYLDSELERLAGQERPSGPGEEGP